jgi:hypothetical protein
MHDAYQIIKPRAGQVQKVNIHPCAFSSSFDPSFAEKFKYKKREKQIETNPFPYHPRRYSVGKGQDFLISNKGSREH